MEPTPVVARPFEAADRSSVLALASRLAEGVAAWRGPQQVLKAVIDWVRCSIDDAEQPDRAVFVAEVEGVVVGVVTVGTRAHFTGDLDAYVGELVVDARVQRSGVGAALMAAAESWASDRGLRHLTLETGAANQPARGFYRALGYLEEDVRLTKPLPQQPR